MDICSISSPIKPFYDTILWDFQHTEFIPLNIVPDIFICYLPTASIMRWRISVDFLLSLAFFVGTDWAMEYVFPFVRASSPRNDFIRMSLNGVQWTRKCTGNFSISMHSISTWTFPRRTKLIFFSFYRSFAVIWFYTMQQFYEFICITD